MKVSRMLAWQGALILCAGFLLALVIRYPNVEARPADRTLATFFFVLLAGVSAGLLLLATRVKLRSEWGLAATMLLIVGEWLVWWYVAFFLWLNSFGS